MTTTGKRLDDLVLGLTVRERVLLAIRPWLAGEEPADGLARNCPEPDRPEMERLFHAIERGNQLLGEAVAFSLEWANTEDVTMAWLECLAAFVARERLQPLRRRLRARPADDLGPQGRRGRPDPRELAGRLPAGPPARDDGRVHHGLIVVARTMRGLPSGGLRRRPPTSRGGR